MYPLLSIDISLFATITCPIGDQYALRMIGTDQNGTYRHLALLFYEYHHGYVASSQ